MDSTSRSPIFNNVSGALQGLDVLKSSGQCKSDGEDHAATDDNFRFGYLVLSCSRWGSVRFEMIGHVLVLFVAFYLHCHGL